MCEMKSNPNVTRSCRAPVYLLLVAVISVGCVPKPRSYQDAGLRGPLRIAVLPLANYTESRDASERVAPILFAQITTVHAVSVVDPGAVEAALSSEPWLMFDRIPPDLIDRLGEALGADALLVGAITGYGYRRASGEEVPHFSVSFRLMQSPGGQVLWSAVHSRDGNDGEWLFGLGRVESLQQLVGHTLREVLETFPSTVTSIDIPIEHADEGGL